MKSPSLLNLRITEAVAGALADTIDRAIRLTAADLAAGAVVTIEDTGVRVRRLPLS